MDRTSFISSSKPTCWDKIISEWGTGMEKKWEQGLIITYAGVIHCKYGNISDELYAHEIVHVRQQEGIPPDQYVDMYFSDKEFRFQKELEAFQAQANWVKKNIRDLNLRAEKINKIRIQFANNYDLGINYSDAAKLIKY